MRERGSGGVEVRRTTCQLSGQMKAAEYSPRLSFSVSGTSWKPKCVLRASVDGPAEGPACEGVEGAGDATPGAALEAALEMARTCTRGAAKRSWRARWRLMVDEVVTNVSSDHLRISEKHA